MSQRSSPEDQSNDLPDWLRRMDGAEETPEWLRRLSQSDEEMALAPSDMPVEEPVQPGGEKAEEEMPDWLRPVEAQAPEQELPSVGEPDEKGVPDWFKGIEGLEVAAPVEPPAETGQTDVFALPQDEEIPDWLAGISTAAGPVTPPESPAVEEVPDWLRGFAKPTEGAVEPAPFAPAAEEVPDWLKGVGEEAEAAEPATFPTQEMEGISDRLRGPGEQAEEAVEPLTAPAEPEEGLPDWLQGVGEGVSQAAEPAGPAPAEQEGLSDWLRLGEQPAEAIETSEPAAIPDWLRGAEEGQPAQEPGDLGEQPEHPDWLRVAGDETTPEAPIEEASGLPDWLTGLSVEATRQTAEESEPATLMSVEEELPDWLSAIHREAPQPTEVPLEGQDRVPDWLAGLGIGEEVPQTVEPSAPAPAQEEGMPDWLTGLGLEAPEQGPVEALIPPTPEEEPTPDWLKDMGEVSTGAQVPAEKGVTDWLHSVQETPVPEEKEPLQTEAAPDWLQGLSLSPADTVVQPEGPTESPVEMPDWLHEAELEGTQEEGELLAEVMATPQPAEEPPPAETRTWSGFETFAEAEIAPLSETEVPSWIQDLRAQAQVGEKELPAETSGPLAGLRGLLSPEPLLGILPRSQYKPMEPAPESHQLEAQLVEQVLSIPAGRPVPAARKAGQDVLASFGRWLIYLALLSAIAAAAFFPAEWSELVRPPEMPEAQAFYNVVQSLPPGGIALIAIDYDASLDGELTPQVRAIVRHLLSRQIRVVTISFTPQGMAIVQDILNESGAPAPGDRYLNLGYLPPHPASLLAFLANPVQSPTILGTGPDPAKTLLGQEIAQLDRVDLIVTVSGNQDRVRWWVEQVGSRYSIDIVAGISAAIAPYLQPYYRAENGQIKGMLVGLAGAASYENQLAAQVPLDYATNNLVLQGYGQLVLVAILILSGLTFVFSKRA